MSEIKIPEFDINDRPFSLDLSPWGAGHADAKEVPCDYFILPGNAVLRRSDLYRKEANNTWVTSQCFDRTVSYTCNNIGYSYPYIRKISDDTELYQRMRIYAEHGVVCDQPQSFPMKDALAAITDLRAKIAELEKQVKQASEAANSEIKVGDWVVVKPGEGVLPDALTGTVLRVTEDCGDVGGSCEGTQRCVRLDNARGRLHITRFRKATDAEIAAELARRKKESEEAKQVMVTVDGVPYISKYKQCYVEFGCARISNTLIRHVEKAMAGGIRFPGDNRAITGIQIGKGFFTREQIAKLAANLID